MLRNTLLQLRAQATRVWAAALAIVLGVAFVAATLTFTGTMERSVQRATAAPDLAADLVVGVDDEASSSGEEAGYKPSDVDRITQVPGVETAEFRFSDRAETTWPGGKGYSKVHQIAQHPKLHWFSLDEGALPAGSNQVAVDKAGAESAGLRIGSVITTHYTDYDTGEDRQLPLTITGTVDMGRSIITGGSDPLLLVPPPVMQQLHATSSGGIDVVLTPDADVETVRQAIAAELGNGYTVQTGQESAQQAVEGMGGASISTAINAVLLPFAGIALFVAGFVIVNTFSILLAQRARQYALLRCVGATKAQIRRSALVEALITGTASSIVGTLLGLVVAAIVAGALDLTRGISDLGGLGITVWAIVIPLLVGIVVTVISALAPTVRASRVSPLAALRPVTDAAATKKMGIVRLIFSVIFLVAGLALTIAGATSGSVPLALPGGLLTCIGVLLFTPTLIPAVARLFGLALRGFGPSGVLATGNAVRNPYRASSTSTALMIGVTLIVLLMTGTATAQISAESKINEQMPIDAMVSSEKATLPPDIVERAKGLPGVGRAAELQAATVTMGYGQYRAFGIAPEDYAGILRHGGDQLQPGTVLVDENNASDIQNGQQVTMRGSSGQVSLRAVVTSDLVDFDQIIVPAAELAHAERSEGVGAVWIRGQEDANLQVLVSNLNTFASSESSSEFNLDGAAPMRAQIDTILGIMLAVVTGLLGVAVIIAVVGIANTLGLSVLERTRESALLRALGLTRGQLRGMLAAEAILLALVGAALGIALGVGFAWAGSAALFQQLNMNLVLTVPWLQILAVLGCSLLAGVLASVFPARRAAKAQPAAALTDE